MNNIDKNLKTIEELMKMRALDKLIKWDKRKARRLAQKTAMYAVEPIYDDEDEGPTYTGDDG